MATSKGATKQPKKIKVSEERILINKIILATTEVAALNLLELLKKKLSK